MLEAIALAGACTGCKSPRIVMMTLSNLKFKLNRGAALAGRACAVAQAVGGVS